MDFFLSIKKALEQIIFFAVGTFVLTSCDSSFKYSDNSALHKIMPVEIYQVDINSSKNPLDQAMKYVRKSNFIHASAYFSEALRINPTSSDAILGMASTQSMLGQFIQADIYFDKYVAAYGETSAYLNDYGFSYMLRGELSRAEPLLLRAKSLSPNSQTIKNNVKALGLLRRARKL
tara:strand:+ start:148 stop:675 length:528 start_codon:yes stop_codon:yes gene_type:complete